MTPKQDEMPALPEPIDELAQVDGFNVIGATHVFTADQMHAYAQQYAEQRVREEREACAALCEAISESACRDWKARYDPHDQGREFGADECETAIRARSKP